MRHSQFIGGVLLVWGFTCLAGCQSAQSPKGATDDVEDIILGAIQDFFQALEARDAVRLSLVLPRGCCFDKDRHKGRHFGRYARCRPPIGWHRFHSQVRR